MISPPSVNQLYSLLCKEGILCSAYRPLISLGTTKNFYYSSTTVSQPTCEADRHQRQTLRLPKGGCVHRRILNVGGPQEQHLNPGALVSFCVPSVWMRKEIARLFKQRRAAPHHLQIIPYLRSTERHNVVYAKSRLFNINIQNTVH